MKKIIAFLFALMLVVSMAVPTYALTPAFKIPDIPDFSDIEFDIKFEIPDSVWNGWFEKHPISWKPVIEIDPDVVPEIDIDPDVISGLLDKLRG